jgi:hypothetical protein
MNEAQGKIEWISSSIQIRNFLSIHLYEWMDSPKEDISHLSSHTGCISHLTRGVSLISHLIPLFN